MFHEKAGESGTRNRGRYQVAQSGSYSDRIWKYIPEVETTVLVMFIVSMATA